MRLATLLAALINILFCDYALSEPWKAEMVDYGTYEIERGGEMEDENVAGHLIITHGKKLIKQSEEVIARLGTNFGFRYRLTGPEDEVEATIRVIHPKPLKDPTSGKEFSTSEWSQSVPTNHTNWNTGWIFEHDWEIVAGDWIMQLMIEDEVMLEKTFRITDGRKEGD